MVLRGGQRGPELPPVQRSLDGTEQPYTVAGQTVWLHPVCLRFYVEGRRP
jgi:hypothetical protein